MSDYQNFDNEKINEIANEINIKEYFEQDFDLVSFADWYVAVPKAN